jgi:hypothetical protein
MCYLYGFVSPLGMSLPYALAFLSALSFELSATPAFSLQPSAYATRILLSNSKCKLLYFNLLIFMS